MLLECIHELRYPNPSLNRHPLRLAVHLKHLVHEGQVHHAGLGEAKPIGREPGADGTDPAAVLLGVSNSGLKVREGLRLEEDSGVYLVGATPVGNRVEVVGKRGVAEDLGLLVLGIRREGEGIVGGGAAPDEEDKVAGILSEFGVGVGGGGEGAEEVRSRARDGV